MRWKTAHRNKARQFQWEPVRCAKHGVPYLGGGWVSAAGLRFALFECPRPGCHNFKMIGDKDAKPAVFDGSPF